MPLIPPYNPESDGVAPSRWEEWRLWDVDRQIRYYRGRLRHEGELAAGKPAASEQHQKPIASQAKLRLGRKNS